jgi:hypothetical protein
VQWWPPCLDKCKHMLTHAHSFMQTLPAQSWQTSSVQWWPPCLINASTCSRTHTLLCKRYLHRAGGHPACNGGRPALINASTCSRTHTLICKPYLHRAGGHPACNGVRPALLMQAHAYARTLLYANVTCTEPADIQRAMVAALPRNMRGAQSSSKAGAGPAAK